MLKAVTSSLARSEKLLEPALCPPAWLVASSFIYLLLPVAIFMLTWVKLAVGLPVALLLLGSTFQLWQANSLKEESPRYFTSRLLLLLAVLALVWCLLSGIGGWFFQRFDYLKHNAIFRELVQRPWPVHFAELPYTRGAAWLNYYMAWYLPPALVAKATGIASLEGLSLLWSWAGAWLVLCWAVYFVPGRWWWGVLPLLLFGGAEAAVVAGQLLEKIATGELNTAWLYHTLRTGWEVAFANKVFRYMAHTVLLTWSPQFAIGVWLATALAWHFLQTARLVAFLPLAGVCLLLWSPMATAGLALLCLLRLRHEHLAALLKPLPLLATAAAGFVLVAFFMAHLPLGSPSFTFQETGLATFAWKYPLFLLIEYLLLILLMWRFFPPEEQRKIFSLCLLLALFPFLKFGYNNDWLIQSGVAPLFVLSLYLGRFLAARAYQKMPRWQKAVFFTLLLLMAANPARYWLISLFRPVLEPQLPTATTVQASAGLAEAGFAPEIGRQYLGQEGAFFYQVLARR